MRLIHEFVTYDDAYLFAKEHNIDKSEIQQKPNFIVETEVDDEKLYDVTYTIYSHFGKEHHKVGNERIVLPQMPYMEMKAYINKVVRNRSPNLSIVNLRVKERVEKPDAV